MTFALRQSVKLILSKVIPRTSQIIAKSVSKRVIQNISARGLSMTNSLNKNIWCKSKVTPSVQLNKVSGCCNYYAEVDGNLVQFLSEEIAAEHKTKQISPEIPGWNVKTDGSGVVLMKQFNDETIKVEFDVNHTVDSESERYIEDGHVPAESDKLQMSSRPPFEVKIIKKSGRILRFLCEFIDQDLDIKKQGEDDVEDQFSIVEMRLDKDTKDGEGFEHSYTLSGSVMDLTLYDMLMDMLDERGVDDEFITNMVSFSTAYEHQLYIQFLENLKQIVSKKKQ